MHVISGKKIISGKSDFLVNRWAVELLDRIGVLCHYNIPNFDTTHPVRSASSRRFVRNRSFPKMFFFPEITCMSGTDRIAAIAALFSCNGGIVPGQFFAVCAAFGPGERPPSRIVSPCDVTEKRVDATRVWHLRRPHGYDITHL